MHRCYSCDPSNPYRIYPIDADGVAARVPGRFVGPPGNANGGIATALLACPALRAAASEGIEHAAVARINARIRAGVPVDAPLGADVSSGGSITAEGGCAPLEVAIVRGEQTLVSGSVEIASFDKAPEPGQTLSDVPEHLVEPVAELSAIPVPERAPFFEETGEHPIPRCFSCGPEHPDGLHIYPRVVEDGVVCAPWRPAAEFDDGGGALSTLVLTSAIDCSSGICMPVAMQRELLELDQFFLLGSLDVRYLRVPALDGAYRVAAKMLRRDGRKFFGLSALVDDRGVAYAVAESTWIIAGISRTEAFGTSA
jgi:hypothetical protein